MPAALVLPDPMSEAPPKQIIRVAERQVELPEGVTVAEWAIEKLRWQNPRIRAFLGCLRLLSGVLESNYALLHCSPERLVEIWSRVREVVKVLRTELAPLLAVPSRVPGVESSRQRAEQSLALLDDRVLSTFDRFPEKLPLDRLIEVRKLLCISIDQIHSFLQDTFGELMASDPRSQHDADYFLSRRFPQDIDEAEWLHASVERLNHYLVELDKQRSLHFSPAVEKTQLWHSIPDGQVWDDARDFILLLLDGLTEKLKGVLALRGIRFDEMEVLDRYTVDVPIKCRMLLELQQAGCELAETIRAATGKSLREQEQSVRYLRACHEVLSRRMARLMIDLDTRLRDLTAFVPLWLESIEKRRALLLRRSPDEPTHA